MQALIEALATNPLLLGIATTLLGLLVGSFLNVVILRLPKMMEADWKNECRMLLEVEPPADEAKQKITLSSPPSCCPSCKAPIRSWQNIPVISWLLLRGRCAKCRTPISIQYPLVELISGVAAAVCVWRFGWSPQLAAALILSWGLIALTVIDLHHTLLPDDLTLPLLWLGLLISTVPVFATAQQAAPGAACGYISLWLVARLFELVTRRERGSSMGEGDFKLLAVLGAWFGALALPTIILLSSVVGAAIGITMILFRGRDRNLQIPFGPYLAGAGWLTLIWGETLGNFILRR